jgi:hypothetical protein
MVCLLAVVAGGTIGAFLGSVLWLMFGDLVLAAVSWLGRAFRDMVEGFKNAVEWLVYGAVTG